MPIRKVDVSLLRVGDLVTFRKDSEAFEENELYYLKSICVDYYVFELLSIYFHKEKKVKRVSRRKTYVYVNVDNSPLSDGNF